MEKGDKLRVIVSKGDDLLECVPLRKGQIVLYWGDGPNNKIEIDACGEAGWLIDPKAVEAV